MRVYIKLVLVFLILLVPIVLFFTYEFGVSSVEKCTNLPEQNDRKVCLAKLIKEVVIKEGVSSGLDIIYKLSLQSSDFSNNCHDYIHIVGNTAYDRFVQTGEVDITNQTTICAYGFYHGFMEALVSNSGDVSIAKDFCQKVRDEVPAANLACFHGIGHGWAGTHDKSLWGDEMAMVKPALEMCEKVTSDPHELKICATGVFDSISLGYYNQLYDLEINKEEPFWLCKVQPDKYKEPCYMDMVPAIVWLGNYEFETSLAYVEKAEVSYRELVVETIADNIVRFMLNRQEELFDAILVCRSLEDRYIDRCLTGIAEGAFQFGQPEIEYKQGLGLCEDSRMTFLEKDICLKTVIEYSFSSYSREKFSQICDINPSYKNYCQKFQ